MEDLNKAAGHRVFESNAKQKIHGKNHSLDSYFEHMIIQFDRVIKKTKMTEKFDQHVVVVNDFEKFIDKVVQVRNLDKNHCLTRIGIDGGEVSSKFAHQFSI